MIKKLLCMSLIMCEVIWFTGCEDNTTDPVTATVTSQSSDGSIKGEETTEEPDTETTGEQNTEPTSDSASEPTSEIDIDSYPVSTEDVYEQFESYTIKKVYLIMRADAGVNVRKGPSETYGRVNGIAKGQVVNVIGQCVETGWYMISLNGVKGFVSNQFLVMDEESNNLVLGDVCPYEMYVKTEHDGQLGWFFRADLGWQPLEYRNIVEAMTEEGYTVECIPVYIGTWRDVGDVMWFGYSKP